MSETIEHTSSEAELCKIITALKHARWLENPPGMGNETKQTRKEFRQMVTL